MKATRTYNVPTRPLAGRLVIGLLIFGLLLGFFLAKDYGMGWDGMFQYRLGQANYKIYLHPLAPKTDESFGPFSHEYHGPFYQTVAYSFSRFSTLIWGETYRYAAFFFADYLSFLVGVISLYLLGKRVMRPMWSLVAALLYVTQPLLFGHAFINPKDTPFLGLLLLSVYAGVRMVDQFALKRPPIEERLNPWLGRRWLAIAEKTRRRLNLSMAIWLGLVVLALLLRGVLATVIGGVVAAAVQADPASWLGELVQQLAPNLGSLPLANYQQHAVDLFFQGLRWLLGLWLLLWLILAVDGLAGEGTRRQLLADLWPRLKYDPGFAVIFAGAALGMTSATRALAFLAGGGLVTVYALLRLRRKALRPLLAYIGVAMVALYASWPYLWAAPVSRYIHALTTLSAFPWPGEILYNGQLYVSSTLPRDYLPRLIALQFTEPLVLLALPGMVLAVVRVLQGRKRAELLVPLLWFCLPFAAVLFIQPNMYDNFRHFLFITPPLFLFAGLMLEKIGLWLRNRWLVGALTALALLPGIIHCIQLHPYQYIYFNSLTGGEPGAFRHYELDYWATSTRETFEYLNQQAEPLARVVVWGPESTSRLYAREDLDLVFADELSADVDLGRYDYAVLSSRINRDLYNVPHAPEVYRVEREGATLMVVRRLSPP